MGNSDDSHPTDKIDVNFQLEFLEQRYKDAKSFYKLTIGAITLLIFALGFIIGFMSISTSRDVTDATRRMDDKVNNAIKEMERKFEVLSGQALKYPKLTIIYNNEELNNKVLFMEYFNTSEIIFRNIGERATGSVSIKLFSTKDLSSFVWQEWKWAISNNKKYKFLLNWSENIKISPGQEWNMPIIEGPLFSMTVEFRLEIYYEIEKPAIAVFKIEPPNK